MTIRAAIRVVLAIALCAVGSACSDPARGAQLNAAAPPVRGTSTDECGNLDAPPHGTVDAPLTGYGAVATYVCSAGYHLVGAARRTCQADGTWSGTAPTCSFAAAGSSCGSCGGTYDADGMCSVATPANLGAPCDLGPGQGACGNGGTIACGGPCQPVDPSIGDPTPWHIFPAPNGSWDWDCDGAITMRFVPTPVPPECSSYADDQGCNAAPTIEYVTEANPCGEQETLFKRDCDWKTLGPTCLDTPAGHRVVFQGCR